MAGGGGAGGDWSSACCYLAVSADATAATLMVTVTVERGVSEEGKPASSSSRGLDRMVSSERRACSGGFETCYCPEAAGISLLRWQCFWGRANGDAERLSLGPLGCSLQELCRRLEEPTAGALRFFWLLEAASYAPAVMCDHFG